jgi:hypothetical protein
MIWAFDHADKISAQLCVEALEAQDHRPVQTHGPPFALEAVEVATHAFDPISMGHNPRITVVGFTNARVNISLGSNAFASSRAGSTACIVRDRAGGIWCRPSSALYILENIVVAEAGARDARTAIVNGGGTSVRPKSSWTRCT